MPKSDEEHATSVNAVEKEADHSHSTVAKPEATAKTIEETAASTQEVDDFGLPVRKKKDPQLAEDDDDGNDNFEEASDGTEKGAIASTQQESVEHKAPVKNPPEEPLETKIESKEANEHDIPSSPTHRTTKSRSSVVNDALEGHAMAASEWSHQALAPQKEEVMEEKEDEWQTMPAYAPYKIYNDDGKLVADEAEESDDEAAAYAGLGGAGKGYTRVQIDEDAQSATSMDDNTAYLFKERGTNLQDEDDDQRDPLAQMQATKDLLTEGQRVAYVGLARLSMIQMAKDLDSLERTRGAKKEIELALEAMKMWSQKMMVRLYSHMEIDSSEQVMIEQLADHGVEPGDLAPALMQNARVKNPAAEDAASERPSMSSPNPDALSSKSRPISPATPQLNDEPPPYDVNEGGELPEVRTPSQLPDTKKLDIDLRWTVLCDLFLVLIADSIYDSRSRRLVEIVGSYLSVSWLEICRFEKRVIDALEMQEAAAKENWNENDHMDTREKKARNRRLMMMGLATVGGGLVIGLSAGLLAPVIGAGLAAGFTTIGVAGTSSFLAGAGGAAIVTTTGIATGSYIGVKASHRRTGPVKTFEYRPLHNNKKVNLIVSVGGWMSSTVDDVRLPFSTVDPIMGDIYSVFWEPEMLQSMGQTINILATEALTQGLQQILGATILMGLMAALQLPIVLTKLAYLIDNPWTVSLARADLAGLILADSLIDRNLGSRPITLVGFSLGARVIFSCLRELASKGAFGLIQNVYLFGSPMVAKKDEYLKAKSVVSGRFVNGYARNDWILGYLFRATSGGIMRVSGLAPIEVHGIENVDCTEFVPGHMVYREAMPRLLREVGWEVESEEFTEIEDPDPENHNARQRQLINEIEEARKELEQKPDKKRFGFFSRKKLAEKKEWEMYDDKLKNHPNKTVESLENKDGGMLFDLDAIQKEIALATATAGEQPFEIKQLESTLPPMRIASPSPKLDNPRNSLRETKSFDGVANGTPPSRSTSPNANASNGHLQRPDPHRSQSTRPYHSAEDFDNHTAGEYDEDEVSMSFEPSSSKPHQPWSSLSSAAPSASSWSTPTSEPKGLGIDAPSPQNKPSDVDFNHNAWADDYDEFGQEKEVKMTFA